MTESGEDDFQNKMAVDRNSDVILKEKGHRSNSKLPYPKAVFLIVVTEFCERFSYYGMRAVLTIYMTTMLGFSDNLATTVYHTFLLLCYGLPFFWGIIADACLGKYKTIVYVSIIFALGNSILTLSSVSTLHLPPAPLSMLGLILMAIGTGGMKPCVAPLGGDQFIIPEQEKQLQQFFSVFLFAVSVGNMFSTVLTPVLRTKVQCFGETTCYAIAFGIPTCLMITAIVIFVSGKRFYKINKPDGNIALDVFRCVSYALSQRSVKKKEGLIKPHWLDYASDKFDENLISDIKGLLRVLIYYVPVPWFFALYEQLGSRWTLQATRMNGDLGSFTLLPDQMQVCNAILMFIFIPVFETLVYPMFRRCNIFRRPLQKMVVGGFLAALSFTVAGIVELQIQNYSAVLPSVGETNLNIINTLPCQISLSTENTDMNNNIVHIEAEESYIIQSIKERDVTFNVKISKTSCINKLKQNYKTFALRKNVNTNPGAAQTAVIALTNGKLNMETLTEDDDVKKSKEGKAKLRFVYTELTLLKHPGSDDIAFQRPPKEIQLVNDRDSVETFFIDSKGSIESTTTHEVKPDRYTLFLVNNTKVHKTVKTEILGKGDVNLGTGGSYIVTLHQDYLKPEELKIQMSILTSPNEVHILWLLPQYILMAWAEIMFMISGMEFSFTEAPKSMKSVLQSCWHMSNAVGNVIVIISAQIKSEQVTQFFVFAGLVALNMFCFAFMASSYKYVNSESCNNTPKERKDLQQNLNSTTITMENN